METPQEDTQINYHSYESNPMPWWLALLWLCFFVFATIYLFLSLL